MPEEVLENSNGPVIETINLSKQYKDVLAVDGLNIKVKKGEIYGFLGPNGAGKTTTLKMIMALAKPTDGEVLVNGRKSTKASVEIRKDIGFLPERVAFYDNLTPLQTLNFFSELKGADKSECERLIEEVGLKDAMNRKVGTFSKGMRQLLGVAQAMIGNPSIYILDEPMSGLDPQWVKVIRERIKAVNEQGATIFFSSHILSEVQTLAKRVGVINKGRLIAEDSLANINEKLHLKPRLEITTPGLNGIVPEGIQEIEGVYGVGADGDTLFITCTHNTRIQVLTALQDKGLNIQDMKTIEPSLEEAFMKLIDEDKKEAE